MEIHELNTKALTDPAYVPFDDGTDTYKAEFNEVVENAANAAVAEADLTNNPVAFTSGDAASPTAWTNVSVITTGSTLATLFNRISTMVKNVRYIWNLLGSSSFSNVASTLTGAIGNTALTTTAQTLSGAIAEHESDISTLNSNTVNTVFASSDTSKYTLNDVRIVRHGRIYVLMGEIKCISPSTSSSIGIVSSGMPSVVSGVVFVPAWGAGNASKDALGVQFGNQGVFLTYGSAGGYYDFCIPMVD